MVDVPVQIGEDPSNSTLTASLNGSFNDAIDFTGALRVALTNGDLSVGMLGQAKVTVHDQPLTFTGELDIAENGATFAATMLRDCGRHPVHAVARGARPKCRDDT
jgi:hypothetical protein